MLSVHIIDNDLSFNIKLIFSVIPTVLNETQRNESIEVIIGTDVSLCKVIHPFPEIAITYEWINPFDKHKKGYVKDIPITLWLYNKATKTVAYKLCVNIPEIFQAEYGQYRLHVCNAKGCDDFYTEIILGKFILQTYHESAVTIVTFKMCA